MNSEINKLANWFRANKMAVNISKTKYIIFHTKGKRFTFNNNSIVYNENEIGKPQDPALVTPLERIYDAHPLPECRSYKHSPSTCMPNFYAANSLKLSSVLTEQKIY